MSAPAGQTESSQPPIGMSVRSPGRTIGEGDFAVLTTLTWMTGELHSNRELMTSDRGERILGRPGERVLPLPVVGAIAVGLGWSNGLGRTLRSHHATRVVRSLSCNITSAEPVFPGDTLWVESVVSGMWPDDSGHNVLEVSHRVFNQRREDVALVVQRLLLEPPADRLPMRAEPSVVGATVDREHLAGDEPGLG